MSELKGNMIDTSQAMGYDARYRINHEYVMFVQQCSSELHTGLR
jgi:hypothetical protein